MPLPVITDGKIVKESLKALEISNKNITDRLKKKKLTPENVFLMTLDRNGTENIVKREAGL